MLLSRAAVLGTCGIQRFVVATNNGDFARISDLGGLYVLTLNEALVSERLATRASGVFVLERRHELWSIAAGSREGIRDVKNFT